MCLGMSVAQATASVKILETLYTPPASCYLQRFTCFENLNESNIAGRKEDKKTQNLCISILSQGFNYKGQ